MQHSHIYKRSDHQERSWRSQSQLNPTNILPKWPIRLENNAKRPNKRHTMTLIDKRQSLVHDVGINDSKKFRRNE